MTYSCVLQNLTSLLKPLLRFLVFSTLEVNVFVAWFPGNCHLNAGGAAGAGSGLWSACDDRSCKRALPAMMAISVSLQSIGIAASRFRSENDFFPRNPSGLGSCANVEGRFLNGCWRLGSLGNGLREVILQHPVRSGRQCLSPSRVARARYGNSKVSQYSDDAGARRRKFGRGGSDSESMTSSKLDIVTGRDVAPVAETEGERYIRRALLDKEEAKVRRKPDSKQSSSGRSGQGSESTVSVTNSKEVGKKKKIPVVNSLNHNEPSCYGCGVKLQTKDVEAPGYVALETYELKKKHHQLKTLLCGRCRLLSQGHMIPAVGGLGGYGSGKGFVGAEELRTQLSHLRHQKVLVIKLVDIVDFNGSFLTRVRDLVGANPIIMVLTKCDLLPEGTDLGAVSDWLQEATLRKKLNVVSIHMTSAKAKTGIKRVVTDIASKRLGRDVYVLGSANVGKSAFVTALLQEMARLDPFVGAALRRKPIQSAMPGTTLGPIQFEAFSGGARLFDTPGVHLHHRMAAVVDPEDVALLAPRRRLRGYVIAPQRLEEEALEPEEDSDLFEEGFLDRFLQATSRPIELGSESLKPELEYQKYDELDDDVDTEAYLSGMTFFWGGVVRIDVIKAPSNLSLTFFGPSAIKIRRCSTESADEYYEENIGSTLTPPTASKVESWVGLGKVQDIIFDLEEGTSRPVGDIAISGLGWITVGWNADRKEDGENDHDENPAVVNVGDKREDDDELSASTVEFVLHTPKPVEVFVRASMPLGKDASKWYTYEELDDAELASRPAVYY